MRVRRTDPDASIPTSSMADIAFLLIIFFMVTAVFSATKGLVMTLPTDDSDPPIVDPDPAVYIHVEAGRVVVDCREMEVGEIPGYLAPKLARNPNKPVILYTDPDAAYRSMVRVYDVLSGTAEITVPTLRDIDEYIELFGANPFAAACDEGLTRS